MNANKYVYIFGGLIIISLIFPSCFLNNYYYIDEQNNKSYGIQKDGICNFSISFLSKSQESWTSHDDLKDYLQLLDGKITTSINVVIDDKYKLKKIKLRIKDFEKGNCITEEGLYYNETDLKYNSIDDFVNNYNYANSFIIEIFYNEKVMKDLKKIIFEFEITFVKEGIEEKVSFSKVLTRKTKILTFLEKM